jgi:hypothetical protein
MIRDSHATPSPTLKVRMNALLREVIWPTVASQGFISTKDTYTKELDHLTWVIDIQRSRWSDVEEAQFTMNCGVFLPAVTSVYLDRPEATNIGLTDCCVHARLGMLTEDRLDKWWKFRADDEVATTDRLIAGEISAALTEHVIPFLGRFQSEAEVLRFLARPRTERDKHVWPQNPAIAFCYAAIIASRLQRRRDATTYLESARDAALGSPIESIVKRLEHRLQTE